MRMKSKISHTYQGRRLRAGEEFTADNDKDAHLLRTIGRAEDVKAAPVANAPAPNPVAAVATNEQQERPKRTYRRRDLTVEGSQE